MSPDQKRLWGVVAALVAVAAALLLFGRARERLAPVPYAAHVAIEPEGADRAVVGLLELDADRPFRLRAVVEAETWDGETIYWTEANALEIAGRPVAEESLRRYPRDDARLLWFTVEGARPYLEIGDASPESALEFREVFRPEWPRVWSVPGMVAAGSFGPGSAERTFGTQRYHLRVEFFGPESEIVPRAEVRSAGAAELPAAAATFPTVTASLPGALESASSVFGLTQLERAPQASAEIGLLLAEWTARRIAFSRLSLIRETLDGAAATWDGLDWRPVEIDGSTPWGGSGDLVRAGPRVVYLYRDRGVPGRLDDDDLCFDYDRGAAVRRLGDIFTGEGLVELAELPLTAFTREEGS